MSFDIFKQIVYYQPAMYGNLEEESFVKEMTALEKWYFINSGPCSPSFNMALDEALLDWHSEGSIPPVIRFYEWNPATLSMVIFSRQSAILIWKL